MIDEKIIIKEVQCDRCGKMFIDKPSSYIQVTEGVEQVCDNCLKKPALLETQHTYYQFLPALFEITKEIKNHTFDIINSKKEEKKFGVRYFYAGTVDFLKKHLEAMGMLKGEKLVNLYRSNALLKPNSVPVFSYNLPERRNSPEYQDFDTNYASLCEGFDIIFDIDSPKKEVMDAYEVTKKIKAVLDEYKLPYYIKNSGTRGFHIIISADWLPKMPIEDLISTIRAVLYNFGAIHFVEEYIDLSVANLKGLIKCSYSLDCGNVSLPLTDWQFNNFKPENVNMDYVLKNNILKNRGLLVRNHGLTDEVLRHNVLKFIKDYK